MKENESQSQEEIYHPLVLKRKETRNRHHGGPGSWTAAKEKVSRSVTPGNKSQAGRKRDGNRDVQVLI